MKEKIKLLTLQCDGIACSSAVAELGKPHTKVTLTDVPVFELMQKIIKEVGINQILDHFSDDEIRKYLEGGNDEAA